ncbi:MAG TPA: multiheme c-type cytochrome [Terriglobia bacterium]|nr:multiheme c-type cytochrome [Terriglobia bacterium]
MPGRSVVSAGGLFLVLFVCSISVPSSLQAISRAPHQNAPAASAHHPAQPTGFVGTKVCAECHTPEAATQPGTPMAHAGKLAADSEVLRINPDMSVRIGPYLYRIQWQAGRATYSVSDGTRTISVPLLLAVGDGVGGQTYVFERNGGYWEARVSFYASIDGLDVTIGQRHGAHGTVEEAIGREMTPEGAATCFGCHFTGAVSNGQLDVAQMTPGVTCEHCHGPGKRHVAAMKKGDLRQLFITNPAHLSPGDSVKFCGSCHRTIQDVHALRLRRIVTIRFQAYRLVLSRCWNPNDPRITCFACHDPHQNLPENVSSYDSKCLACHIQKPASTPTHDHPGAACPVGTSGCVNCHMPRGELPGGHTVFTDHFIHVAKPDEPFPQENPSSLKRP